MSDKHEGMEKFGVAEDDELKKEAQKHGSPTCPVCGRRATKHGLLLICPVHGSEPFEPSDLHKRKRT